MNRYFGMSRAYTVETLTIIGTSDSGYSNAWIGKIETDALPPRGLVAAEDGKGQRR
jgi:hypothetical protein